MPDAPAVDLTNLSNLDLIAAEENVRKMYVERIVADVDPAIVESLHSKVAKEMRRRGFVYEPLAVTKAKHTAPAAPTSTPHLFEKAADADTCVTCELPDSDHVTKFAGQPIEDDVADAFVKTLPPMDDGTRQKFADEGIALPDGSFYIPDEAHLHAAVRLVGQAPDPQAAMQHIIERARAMGLEHALPPAWQVNPADPAATPQIGPGAHSLPGQAGQDPTDKPGSCAPGAQPMKPGAPGAAGAPGAGAPPAPGAPPAGAGGAAPSAPGGAPALGPDPAKKPGLMKRIAKAVGIATGAEFDEDTFMEALEAELDPTFDYAVVKARGEERYTLGPVYMPDTLDAHGEWTTAEDLQKSVWDYVRDTGSDRTVYLQHSNKPAGEWVEVMTWPHEVHATMTKSVDGVQKAEETVFPAGTAYMGVVWNDWAWEKVKKGELTGFSMGGYAQRVEADIDA